MGIRECRIIAGSVRAGAKAHGTKKLLVSPLPKPGLTVRRQIGRIDRAEWRVEPPSACEWLRGVGRVAACAISSHSQRLATRDRLTRRFGLGRDQGECTAQKQGRQNRAHYAVPPLRRWMPIGKYNAK